MTGSGKSYPAWVQAEPFWDRVERLADSFLKDTDPAEWPAPNDEEGSRPQARVLLAAAQPDYLENVVAAYESGEATPEVRAYFEGELRDAAVNMVINETKIDNVPEFLKRQECFWLAFTKAEIYHAGKKARQARKAGKTSAQGKKRDKEKREKHWINEAKKLLAKDPSLSKEDLVTAIAEKDKFVAAGEAGPNAISRALKIRKL